MGSCIIATESGEISRVNEIGMVGKWNGATQRVMITLCKVILPYQHYIVDKIADVENTYIMYVREMGYYFAVADLWKNLRSVLYPMA